MKLFSKPKKLNQSGFDHVALPVIVVVVFALVGSYFLYTSMAATTQWKGVLEAYKQGPLSSSYCLSTQGGSTGSKVVLNKCSTTYNKNQVWTQHAVKTTTVFGVKNVSEIQLQSAAGTNECLNDWQASKTNGNQMKLYPCKSTDLPTTWVWGVKFGGGNWSHMLANLAASGGPNSNGKAAKCLDDYQGSHTANTKVDIYSCKSTGQSNQMWFEAGAPKAGGGGSSSGGGSSGGTSPGPTTVSTCSSPKPTAPVSGYTIVRCDDFNSGFGNFGTYNGGGSGTVVGAGRIPSQCSVSGGYLHLVQNSNGATCGGSLLSYSQRYGYWEVRMRAYSTGSSGSAPHPVLILWPDNTNSGTKTSEIDYFETDLGTPAHGFLHCAGGGSVKNVNCFVIPNSSVDYSQWHVYGLKWTPTSMTGYIDGQQWWTVTGSKFNSINPYGTSHQTIQLDNLSGSTPVKAGEMDVDWAHMYK